jgi:hypothetical protein
MSRTISIAILVCTFGFESSTMRCEISQFLHRDRFCFLPIIGQGAIRHRRFRHHSSKQQYPKTKRSQARQRLVLCTIFSHAALIGRQRDADPATLCATALSEPIGQSDHVGECRLSGKADATAEIAFRQQLTHFDILPNIIFQLGGVACT